MNSLDWPHAYALAVAGHAVRRAGWTQWLVLRGSLGMIGSNAPGDLHPALNTEFGRDEFFAHDWTDEPWADASGGVASQPPPGAIPPTAPGATPPAASGGWSSPANPAGASAVNPPPSAIIGPDAPPAPASARRRAAHHPAGHPCRCRGPCGHRYYAQRPR